MLPQQGQWHRVLVTMSWPVSRPTHRDLLRTQCHDVSAATPIGGAGHGITADVPARAINDSKMGSVAVSFYYV